MLRPLWNKPLTSVDIENIVTLAPNISKYFRGVVSRDEIQRLLIEPNDIECALINLDLGTGLGTHWTSYFKKEAQVFYYDSFGNLFPPQELITYLKNCEIWYNRERDQEYNSVICGHLCLYFLYKMTSEEYIK